MSTIIGTDEYTDVPLIEVGDKVEGGQNGAANKQAKALVNRTDFLNNKHNQLDQKVDGLTADDVGADSKGHANSVMNSHVTEDDPHGQYLKTVDADTKFVTLSGANLPGGYLQLDPGGKIPAALLSLISTKYEVVPNKAARLALASNPNLIIVVQVDVDQLFYLNGGLNPAVESNWIAGQAATVSGVASVFGRSNQIVAENGDYNADQITETTNRKFVTPAEKTAWNQKQSLLVSGTNIKTFKGISLLGVGDFNPTPDQLGCAAKVHTHPTTEITNFDNDVKKIVGTNVIPGTGVSIGYDSTTGKTVISSAPSTVPDANFVIVEKPGSIAGQIHGFSFDKTSKLGFQAFALKSEPGATNQVSVLETFDSVNAANYNVSPYLKFTGKLEMNRGGSSVFALSGDKYLLDFDPLVDKFTIRASSDSIVPAMTGNSYNGYTASASSEWYSSSMPSAGRYYAYKAFDRWNNNGEQDGWASQANDVPSASTPQWLRIDLPAAVALTGYAIQNRLGTTTPTPITKWTLQGSNDNGGTWENIGAPVVDQTNLGNSVIRNFPVTTTKAYKSYRLLITERSGSPFYCFVGEWMLYVSNHMMFLDADGTTGYTVDANGNLVTYPNVTNAQIDQYGFSSLINFDMTKLTGKTINKLVAAKPTTIITDIVPKPQIAVPKLLVNGGSWSAIVNARWVASLPTNSAAACAVTRDGLEYFSWNGSAWISIGSLDNSVASATKLMTQGMTMDVMQAITQAQWLLLYSNNNNVIDKFQMAYAMKVTDAAAAPYIDTSSLTINETPSWKLQNPSEVEIRWRGDNITFKTITAGNYILAYQIP